MGVGGTGADRSPPGSPLHDRRTFLHTLYGATLGALLAACGSNDADVFAAGEGAGTAGTAGDITASGEDGTTRQALRVQTEPVEGEGVTDPSTSSAESTSSSTTTGDTSVTTTSSSDTTAATSTSSDTTAGGGGGALPSGGTMVVAFTYEPTPGGKNVPPYVAVWIEDGSGVLLTTVALWYQQFGRGERWLPDLTRWYNVDQDRLASGGSDTIDAISGPTRSPGSFQVAWDGTVNGSPAPAGTYFVCVESARERGPYSLIRQAVDLNGSTGQQELSGDGELVNASMAVTA